MYIVFSWRFFVFSLDSAYIISDSNIGRPNAFLKISGPSIICHQTDFGCIPHEYAHSMFLFCFSALLYQVVRFFVSPSDLKEWPPLSGGPFF